MSISADGVVGPTFWWCIRAFKGECDFKRAGTEEGFAEVTAHEREVHGVEYVEVTKDRIVDGELVRAFESMQEVDESITRFPGSQRESILEEAREYVMQDRQAQHGRPEDNFANIARFWDAWLCHRLKDGEHINEVDVAEMMTLLKKGRKMSNPDNRDNYADEIGYAACAWELHKGMERVDE